MNKSRIKDDIRVHLLANFDLFQYFCRLRQLESLSEEQIIEAVKSACDFFGMPLPQIKDTTYHPILGTLFASSDKNSYKDDIIAFDLQELASLNVSTINALTLVLTHEATHRRTQMYDFPGPKKGCYAKECISDWYMGVRAGMLKMGDISNVIEGLGKTEGCDTHPAGFIRKAFIQNGVQIGFLNRSEHGTNFEYFINDFKDFYFKMLPTLKKEYPKYYNLYQRTFFKKTFDF